jgi:hypothetical protein
VNVTIDFMAKFKPAKGKKSPPAAARPQAIGCVILLFMIFLFVYLVMYYAIKQG